MIANGRIAYANARVRVRKARLLGPDYARRLIAGDRRDRPEHGFAELVDWYRAVLTDYPSARALWLALLRRHEVENLKLVWRARARGHRFERWGPLWRPLGPLEEVRLDACRDCASLPAVVEAVRSTLYGDIAATMLRSHAGDLLAVELGFDRWASRAIADAALALDRSEALAQSLALAVVAERDLEWLRRGTGAFGLAPDAVVGALVYLPRANPAAALAALAAWRPESGPFNRALPRAIARSAAHAADWDGLLLAWRRARRVGCRRAFAGQPFCLAPAVALLLLKEEELRALAAIEHASGAPERAPALAAALAASALGD